MLWGIEKGMAMGVVLAMAIEAVVIVFLAAAIAHYAQEASRWRYRYQWERRRYLQGGR